MNIAVEYNVNSIQFFKIDGRKINTTFLNLLINKFKEDLGSVVTKIWSYDNLDDFNYMETLYDGNTTSASEIDIPEDDIIFQSITN
ncbi:MAG: Unknown protein [uncultured Sulfurovum sp.]|uniref:Uncharacterized protein n=1 Tax=uncultured Sulfurovum sp. TaxID=269237 RepID=A0A6S6SYV0_9BACT|nr:MAG: Unknown protein [uncultured Sulfurovum sp.]